jgi:hypothetical protein
MAKNTVYVLPICLVTIFSALNALGIGQGNNPAQRSQAAANNLRDVFLGTENSPSEGNRLVGRLGILLKTEQGMVVVRPDHAFRSGDRFRLQITANRSGWLHVMHSAAGHKWQQLWPTGHEMKRVEAGQMYEVPPSPGIFIFDKEIGDELFYVAIRTAPNLPVMKASSAKEPEVGVNAAHANTSPASQIINFAVRDPFGGTTRGVVFDPGKEQSDPYLYFSPESAQGSQDAVIQFQLHHSD